MFYSSQMVTLPEGANLLYTMAEEQKDMTGALFINHKKQTDSHPEMQGSIIIDGKKYWLSAWKNHMRKSGEKYLTIKANPVDETQTTDPSSTVHV